MLLISDCISNGSLEGKSTGSSTTTLLVLLYLPCIFDHPIIPWIINIPTLLGLNTLSSANTWDRSDSYSRTISSAKEGATLSLSFWGGLFFFPPRHRALYSPRMNFYSKSFFYFRSKHSGTKRLSFFDALIDKLHDLISQFVSRFGAGLPTG